MNIRKFIAGASAALLVGGTVALATVAPASAHTPEVTADCTALVVNLSNYSASKPGKDAVYHDWSETVVDTPAKDAVPAVTHTVNHHDLVTPEIPAVPTTYVQEWKYVQKNHPGNIQWHTADWNPGYGWDKTGDHRDSTTVLVQGHDAVPAVYNDWVETIVDSPAQDAVPAVTHEVPHHDLVSAGEDAKTNHVSATDNGTTLVDQDFSTSYSHTFPSADKTIAHDYHVVVTAYDDPTGSHGWSKTYNLHVDACEAPPVQPIDGVINPVTQTPPTCDAPSTYTVPEQAEYVKYELSDGVRPVPGTFTLASGSVTIGAHILAEDTVANGGAYNPLSYSVTLQGADATGYQLDNPEAPCYVEPKADKVTHTEKTVDACTQPLNGNRTVTVWGTDITIPQLFDPKTGTFSDGEAVEGDAYVVSTTQVKDADCNAVVVVTSPAPQKPSLLAAPAPVAPTDVLAHTGSDTDYRVVGLAGGLLLLGLLSVAAAYILRQRKHSNES